MAEGERIEPNGNKALLGVNFQSPLGLVSAFIGALMLMGIGGLASRQFFPEDASVHFHQNDADIRQIRDDMTAMRLDVSLIKQQIAANAVDFTNLNTSLTQMNQLGNNLNLRVTTIEADMKARESMDESRRIRRGQ